MLVSCALLLLTIICITVHFLLNYWKVVKNCRNLPCMKNQHIIIGDLVKFRGDGKDFYESLMRCTDEYREHGILCIWFGLYPFIIVFKDSYTQDLIGNMQNIEKHWQYDFLHSWLGRGLLTGTKERWMHSSKILKPSFNYNILNCFVKRIENQINKLLSEMDKTVGMEEVNISLYMENYVLYSMTEIGLGLTKGDGDARSTYPETASLLTKIFTRRMTTPWLWPDLIFNTIPLGKQFKKCVSVLHGITNKVIEERSANYQENMNKKSSSEEEEEEAERKENMTFMDTLFGLHYEGKIDKTFIREEMETIVFGGSDTMTATLQWLLLLIASHPEAQKKLQDEIDDFYREYEEIRMSNIKKLVYMECVIKETLRLYPPVPIIGRVAGGDFKIGTYEVKKGTSLSIFVAALHRDPSHFTDPNTFNPDRFLIERVKHQYAYIPFSGGPRVCIGQKFAYLQMKITLSRILQKYNLKATQKIEEVPPCMEMTLKPSKDIYVKLTHR